MKTYEGMEVQHRYQLHAPAALPQGNSFPYTLYRRLSGPYKPVWNFVGEEKIILPLPGIKPLLLSLRARSLAAIPTRAMPAQSYHIQYYTV
jgi:hypothetical protein